MSSKKALAQLRVYGHLLDGIDFPIVNIHPLADEEEVLTRLGMRPDEVVLCDMYWAFEDWLLFVSMNFMPTQQAMINLSLHTYGNAYAFSVITSHQPIDRDYVNRLLHFLADWIHGNKSLLMTNESQQYTILTGELPGL